MDTMILNKKDGSTEIAEIVTTFKLENFNNNDYVIYKNNKEYYAARYEEKEGSVDLITDLTDEEKKALNNIFEKLHKGGVI